MIRRILAVPMFFTAVALFAPPAQARNSQTGFLDRKISVAGVEYKYQVFVPEGWSPSRKWPIILFLHGAGERGTDGLIQTEFGIGTAIRKDRSRFPAIIVMPQCAPDYWWPEQPMSDMALATLQAASKEFHGDPARTYLTGLSMGGYGSWYIAAAHPHLFAAVVPICGGIVVPSHVVLHSKDRGYPEEPESYAEVAAKLAKTPIWVFHGADDPTINVENSRKLVAALKKAGSSVKYTEYPGVQHNSWDKAYAETDLMPWLLSQHL